ncbi:hypothetical protein WDU94_011384 [Cyamophila willieti]
MKPNMISVAAQQGMYYSSPTPSTPSPVVSDPGSCSMSQSQSVNFSHQGQPGPGGMRHRTPGPQHQGPSPSSVRHPGVGVDPKLLHQQQQQQHSMMRSQLLQQQQQQQQGPGGPTPSQLINMQQQQQSPRPPPPEYKMNPSGGSPLQNMMPPHLQNVLMQQRFGTVPPHQRTRPPMQQQPMPPSGPMMRPQQHGNGSNPLLQQSPHLSNAMQGGPAQRMYIRSQRPPNITPTEALTPSAEWRHMMAINAQQQAQQQAGGPNGYRGGPANFQQMQGVMYNSGGNPGLQLSSMQMQQLPTSRPNNTLSGMHHQTMSMQHSTAQMNLNLQMSQQASMQQQNMNNFNPGGRNNPSQSQGQPSNNGPSQSNTAPSPQQQNSIAQMNQMSQQQQQMNQHMNNFSYQAHSAGNGGFMQQTSYMSHQQSNNTPCSVSSGLNGLPSDFNLDFLDGPVTSSDSSFNDQDILRSLESGASFNLQDIL